MLAAVPGIKDLAKSKGEQISKCRIASHDARHHADSCQAHQCSSGTGYGVILNPWTFLRGTPSVPAFVVHACPGGFATDQRRESASTSGLTNARLFQAFLAYLRAKAQDWK